MTHTWTLREATRDLVYLSLQNPPDKPYGAQTSPRLLNRQLKSYMTEMHARLVAQVLDGYSKFIQHSDTSCDAWCPSLIALLVLCMTAESLQASMRCKEETEKSQRFPINNDEVGIAVRKLDETIEFLIKLFTMKYHQKRNERTAFNPVTSDIDCRKLTDSNPREFACLIGRVVEDYCE